MGEKSITKQDVIVELEEVLDEFRTNGMTENDIYEFLEGFSATIDELVDVCYFKGWDDALVSVKRALLDL